MVDLIGFNFWYWWVLGLILLALEIFVPGAFFLWMAISAGLTGFLMLLAPGIGLLYGTMFFAVFSVISVWAWRKFAKSREREIDQPLLNERGEQLIGRVVTLSEAIVNGHGKVRIEDSIWKVEGPECPVHTRVRIVGVNGTILVVESAESNP